MSDDKQDLDMDSEDKDSDNDDYNARSASFPTSSKAQVQARSIERRAHHNALERMRREDIKDGFANLRDSVPSLLGKVSRRFASRDQILIKAAEYIQFMKTNNHNHQHNVEDLRTQNSLLENQIKELDEAISGGGPGHFDKNNKLNNSEESENSEGEVSSPSSAPVS